MKKPSYMTIDGIPVEIEGEKNILELIRKAGIKLPTFCYHSELSVYGACRMCMVEGVGGRLDAACSAQPRPGMDIRTNTERLRRYRKMILELILANHCRDCTTCQSSKNCKLQDLAARFRIEGVRFPGPGAAARAGRDDSSPCVAKDSSKCILCGDCVRMCNEVQNVGAIDFAYRGSKMAISTAFGEPLAQSGCVGCGQCAAVCPTGAIAVKNDSARLWGDLSSPDVKVTAQIAPAVRVAVGREFGLAGQELGHAGLAENAFGQIVAALRRMGFDEVYDTATGADLTVLEESSELLRRLEGGSGKVDKESAVDKAGGGGGVGKEGGGCGEDGKGGESDRNGGSDGGGEPEYPLFTSCCPAWVSFCEKKHPELVPHLSTCRSPMQMLASVVKEHHAAASARRSAHVAIMPCTAKKAEAARAEFASRGQPNVDYVITTQELIAMIRESGIVFSELEAESADSPFGAKTGAGVIFGVTGGVTEAVLRRISSDKSLAGLRAIAMRGARGMDGVKETSAEIGGREVKIAIASGLKNASALIERIKAGERYGFVEIMACPGGCVSGAGQPYAPSAEKASRASGLYASDKAMGVKRSEENPLMMGLYSGLLRGKVRELLHVHYGGEDGSRHDD